MGRVVFGLVLSLSMAVHADEDSPIVVFGAASTTDAMTALADRFTQDTGIPVLTAFASSSSLARQIEHGAPAAVFVAANPAWMNYLDDQGLLAEGTRRPVAGNRLVLIGLADSGQRLGGAGLTETLYIGLGKDGRLAVGDPLHVPAGIYALQAIDALGLRADLEPRLARAADVRGALALVERGETPLGIVYATDAAVTDRVVVVAGVPSTLHDSVLYPAAVVAAGDGEAARRFLDFLSGPEGIAAFSEAGFTAPP
ncbi:MAG: molybdate ABC transporter substrate-binding protein [Rhodospirillales bacterium]|nr:molybdate ABC transporter substrate-binding protein [Rhodospirillales bacterium]